MALNSLRVFPALFAAFLELPAVAQQQPEAPPQMSSGAERIYHHLLGAVRSRQPRSFGTWPL